MYNIKVKIYGAKRLIEDSMYNNMVKIREACSNLKIDPPQEVLNYFNNTIKIKEFTLNATENEKCKIDLNLSNFKDYNALRIVYSVNDLHKESKQIAMSLPVDNQNNEYEKMPKSGIQKIREEIIGTEKLELLEKKISEIQLINDDQERFLQIQILILDLLREGDKSQNELRLLIGQRFLSHWDSVLKDLEKENLIQKYVKRTHAAGSKRITKRIIWKIVKSGQEMVVDKNGLVQSKKR